MSLSLSDFEDPFWAQPNIPTRAELDEYNLKDEFWTYGILDCLLSSVQCPKGSALLMNSSRLATHGVGFCSI